MSRKRQRPNRKHLDTAQALRMRIVEGRFEPGMRLPPQRDLSRQFRVSLVTLQKAAGQLVREGFLQPKGRRGTFVPDAPPHLYRYAIVFPSRQDGTQYWTDWWSILAQSARMVARAEPPKQIAEYYDITGHADVEDYQRLVADVRAQRLAGIIFLTAPYNLYDTPLSEDCPVPRVYVGNAQGIGNMPSVGGDFRSFVGRALEFAGRQSRRRPILIGMGMVNKDIAPDWKWACESNGMEPARWQSLSVPVERPEAARNLTELLMHLPSAERRPDVLIVTDDHLVEEVTAGLLASKLPEDQLPLVIAHTNFPKLPHALVPVTYLGYDSVQTIRKCMEVLDAQRRGETPPQTTVIPAIFASERSAASSAVFYSSNNFVTAGDLAAAHDTGLATTLHPILERTER